jgi:type I restriction enzyme S subunit
MNNDWIEVELGEVCEINMGQSPPSSSYNYDRNGLPFFQGKAEFTELYPEVKKWCDTPKKVASINDILISVRAPVGATNLANQVCAIGRGLAAISYPKCYKYIFYYLRFIEQLLDAKGTGSTFKAISGSILRSQTIPLAPLPEQRAIVAKIEQLFSELDNGIQNLKTAQRKLTLYRQAVLKKAFEGGFTEQWRKEQGIENGTNEAGLPKGWKLEKCEDTANIVDPQPSHRTPPVFKNGIPFVSIKDVDYSKDSIDLENARSVSQTVLEEHLMRYKLEAGDFIIGKIGTIGRPVRVILPQNYTLSANVVLVQPRGINADFIYYLFRSNLIEKVFRAEANSTTQAAFGIKKTRLLRIPTPPPTEQIQIVQEIESRLSVCDKVQETINQNLQKAEALRQSILKKAFAGNLLTQQELTACRNEPDYAPASELLKEIVN